MAKAKRGKKDQTPYFLFVLGITVFLATYFYVTEVQLGIYWTFGILFGFVLQKSNFCFAASLRNPVIAGSTSILRSLLVAMAIMTIFFPIIQYMAVANGASEIPGRVHSVGVHIALGGFMFGFGMVIASGCATGTLMRIGEGFAMQFIVLIGFLIGTLWGAKDYPWWDKVLISKSPTIHLANVFGWLGAVIIQLILIGILYYLAKKYDEQHNIML